ETGRLLTLESNLTFWMNGPGMHSLGDLDRFMGSQWRCPVDGYVYAPARGDPEHGVPVGTPFTAGSWWDPLQEAVPDDWTCPRSGTAKALFTPHCQPPRDWWKRPYLKTWDETKAAYPQRRMARLKVWDLRWV